MVIPKLNKAVINNSFMAANDEVLNRLSQAFNVFRNNVMYRGERSQRIAWTTFTNEIEPWIHPDDRQSIKTEHSHYLIGEITPDEFGEHIKLIEKNLMKNLLHWDGRSKPWLVV